MREHACLDSACDVMRPQLWDDLLFCARPDLFKMSALCTFCGASQQVTEYTRTSHGMSAVPRHAPGGCMDKPIHAQGRLAVLMSSSTCTNGENADKSPTQKQPRPG